MDKKLKVAVVGLKVGKLHLSDYKNNGNVGEICICTRDRKTLDEVGAEFSVDKRYTSVDEMLAKESLDAVSIAVPNKAHFPLVFRAIESGVNVLVEKPFTINAKQAEILTNLAKERGKVLMINYNKRYESAIYSLKRRIESGEFGEISHIEVKWLRKRGIPWWFPLSNGKKNIGGGPFIDLGVHMIDVAMYLAGNFNPEYVFANSLGGIGEDLAKRRNIADYDVEDAGVALISLKGGTTVLAETAWAYNGEKDMFEIFVVGREKSARINAESSLIFEPDGEKVCERELALEKNIPNIRDVFIDTVLGRVTPQCTAQEGLAAMKIIDAFYKSDKRRKPVKIK